MLLAIFFRVQINEDNRANQLKAKGAGRPGARKSAIASSKETALEMTAAGAKGAPTPKGGKPDEPNIGRVESQVRAMHVILAHPLPSAVKFADEPVVFEQPHWRRNSVGGRCFRRRSELHHAGKFASKSYLY